MYNFDEEISMLTPLMI